MKATLSASPSASEYLIRTAQESAAAREVFLKEEGAKLVQVAKLLGECFRGDGKILILGNGGSASDAQHMSGELIGKMLVARRPLPAIALTTDTSVLTAVGNDFGYDEIFSKQILALGRKGDVVFAISTSGNSANVLVAVKAAKQIGCKVVALTGGSGGELRALADFCLNVSQGQNSCRIQETHIFAIHSIVDLMDRYFLRTQSEGQS
ncbi:MAG TPA: phosphoheptose isomerase [Bdellovibrionales bacterium]|nr:phosphoheptose isomerase [Bdellovibrionales bacterium]HCM40506.1 phosphoheptose isomerase [Bdellovibrionales bacterium]